MSNNTNTEIILAGAAAAFTVDLLIYPLDTLKTRIQSQDYLKTYASSASSKATSAYALRGLYQGVGSVIIATLPAAGIFFTVYESAKSLLTNALPSSIPQPVIHSLASGTAELSSCIVLTPAEVIKQNAQMIRRSGSSSTSLQALRMIQSAEGGAVRRLWMGYTALAARNLPFTAMQFPMFEALRARIWQWRGGKAELKVVGGVERGQGLLETAVVTGVAAGLSGAIAATLTTPTDVVKTRMMLSAGGSEKRLGGDAADLERARSKGSTGWKIAQQVYQEKGVRGLFRGGLLRASWTAVGSGLYLGTYEMSKVWLKRGNQSREDDGL